MNLDKAAKELEEIIKPNSFITFTLKDGIWTDAGYYIPGSHEVYDRVIRSLFREINRRVYGGRIYRRRPRNLPNWTVYETSSGGLRHVHSCMNRPSHVSIDLFDGIVRSCIAKSKWLMPHCEVKEYQGGGVQYILKDGQDGVLGGSLHF